MNAAGELGLRLADRFDELPISGLSEVMGMIAETVFRNIVRERRIVTPGKNTRIPNSVNACYTE